jgi:DNA-binding MarR family transcriptional regulator
MHIYGRVGWDKKNMHDAHISTTLRSLHDAVLDIVGMMNGPQRDELMIRAAGIRVDQVLFPLLVLAARYGPLGVVDLAGRVGRDYTTVSRQIDRLEALGLVERLAAPHDRRLRLVAATAAGEAMNARIDAARERILRAGFADWEASDVSELARLMTRFAETMRNSEKGAA